MLSILGCRHSRGQRRIAHHERAMLCKSTQRKYEGSSKPSTRQYSSASKCMIPDGGAKECARRPPGPSKGSPSPWSPVAKLILMFA
ncbi:hypothetical protein SUGI_1076980 [Cryptomeria japonica]|nr:hypothetical protein SUGI_1076980 [Cryptomeria japonica]